MTESLSFLIFISVSAEIPKCSPILNTKKIFVYIRDNRHMKANYTSFKCFENFVVRMFLKQKQNNQKKWKRQKVCKVTVKKTTI